VVLELIRRAGGDLEEAVHLIVARPSTTFRNVGWYGSGAAPNLRHEPEQVCLRERRGCSVRMQYKVVRLTPNVQAFEVLHELSPENQLIVAAQPPAAPVTRRSLRCAFPFWERIVLLAADCWLLAASAGNTGYRPRF
jgi:hypothetical protein